MNDVLSLVVRKVLPDRAFVGFRRVGGSDQRTKIGDGVVLLEHDRHARTTGHERSQLFEERAPPMDIVKSFGLGFRQAGHAEPAHGEAGFLHAANDFADEVFADTIGLEDGQRTLHGLFGSKC